MRKLLNYLPTHFTVCLIVGIVIQFYYKIWHYSLGFEIGLLSFLLLILWFAKYFLKRQLFTFFSWLSFAVLGMLLVNFQDTRTKPAHYSNFTKPNQQVTFKIDKVLKENLYYHKYLGSVVKVDQYHTKGSILLNIQKDSLSKAYQIGDVLLFSAQFQKINKPLNPYQFDYRKYLEKLGVHHQVFLRNAVWLKSDITTNSIHELAEKFRNKVELALLSNKISGDELAVIKALVLGQRNDVSKELLEEYTNAGAIHILAVSGLHVGIILMLLSFVLKPLERIKYGKSIKAILIILFLWCFAIVAGLSASVVRAVTMFSAVAIGMSFRRKTFVLHSLVISIFVLLLCKPMFVFDVGFQLSYLAVFSIVTIQPKLMSIWKPKFKPVNYFWQLFTVSIAAQIGVLPISLFYFHQFPGLFMLSNLVIIPFIGLILAFGIVTIVLALLNLLPTVVAEIYVFVIKSMNNFMGWISNKEAFLIVDIPFSVTSLLISYLLFFVGIYFLEKRKSKATIYLLITIVLFQFNLLLEKRSVNTTQEFIVFHKSRNTVIGVNKKGNMQVFHSVDSLSNVNFIKAYKVEKQLNEVNFVNGIPNVFHFKNHRILVVDSDGIYKLNQFKNSIVLLTQLPKINMVRMIENLQPKLIIADASNYKSVINYWKISCDKKGVPFYYTGENGAYVLR
jgi:competence protein ComEC